MIYSLYVKAGVILVLVAVLFGTGYHFGGLAPRAQLDELKVQQSQVLAAALLEQQTKSQAESSRLRSVLETYEQAYLTPVDPGISHRVLVYASSASCSLPKSTGNTGGAVPASPEPRGFEDALQGYINACNRDALRLNALQQAWPR